MRISIRRSLASFAAALLVFTAMPAVSAAGQPSAEGGKPSRPVRHEPGSYTLAGPKTATSAPADGLLVVLKSSASDAGKKAAFGVSARAHGVSIKKWSFDGKAVVVGTSGGVSAAGATVALAADPTVESVQPNYTYRATWRPTDPEYGREWHMEDVGAPVAWDKTRGSASVLVAVIDTGVDMDHPDLVDRIDVADGHDFVNNDGYPDDDYGHGTHVAGIIAATANNGQYVAGMASQCSILPVKVLDASGFGSTVNVADGIKWAADRGAKVINMSLGGSTDDPYMETAIQYAQSKGVLVVAAAGNEAQYGASYPALSPGVLGVSAVDIDNQPAWFTNYGPGIDVAAPGVKVWSTTWPGDPDFGGAYTGYMSGTSMATPVVAGIAALIRSQNTTWTWQETATQIEDTAQDLGDKGVDDFYGHGLVRADAAVSGVAPPPSDNDIPGIPLTLKQITQVLDDQADTDDVYKVHLNAGETLDIDLKADPATDFDLFLYGPSAGSVYSAAPLASSVKQSYPEHITYRAGAAGDYYLCVHAYAGAGQYYLSYAVTPPLKVEAARFSNPIAYKIKSLTGTSMIARMNASNVHARITVAMPGAASWTIFDEDIANVAGKDFVFPAWDGKDPLTGKQAPYAAKYVWTLTVTKNKYGSASYRDGILLSNVCFTRSGRSANGVVQVQTGYLAGSASSPQSVNVYVSGTSAVPDQVGIWVTGPAGVKYGAYPTNSPWRMGPGAPEPPTGRLLGQTAIKTSGVYNFKVTGLHDVTYSISVIE